MLSMHAWIFVFGCSWYCSCSSFAMFSLTCNIAAFFTVTIVTAAALHLPQNPSQLIAALAPYNLSVPDSRLISQLNTTTPETRPSHSLNLSVPDAPSRANNVYIDCSYGHELKYDACLDALNTFVYPSRDRPLTIGQRWTGGVCNVFVQ